MCKPTWRHEVRPAWRLCARRSRRYENDLRSRWKTSSFSKYRKFGRITKIILDRMVKFWDNIFSKLREARDPTNYRDKAVKIAVKQQLGRSPSLYWVRPVKVSTGCSEYAIPTVRPVPLLGRNISVPYSTISVRCKPRWASQWSTTANVALWFRASESRPIKVSQPYKQTKTASHIIGIYS